MLNLAAAASHGVPSWKTTPWRSLKVHVSPSGDTDQLVARSGSTSVLPGSARTRPLNIWVTTSALSPFVLIGMSSVSGLPDCPQISVVGPAANPVGAAGGHSAPSANAATSAAVTTNDLPKLRRPVMISPLPRVGQGAVSANLPATRRAPASHA